VTGYMIAGGIAGLVAGAATGGLLRSRRSRLPVLSNPGWAALLGAVIGVTAIGLLKRPQAVSDSSIADFEATVLQADKPVLVDFYADWCPPCRALQPILKELASEYEGRLEVVKVNVDHSAALASRYQVRRIPNVILFYRGQQVERWVGLQPKDTYRLAIETVLGSAKNER